MIYGSVCSGTASASLAWKPLGWTPKFFSEIEPFPNAILAHRWPEVPNLGDFTKIGAEHGPVDLLAGGTPCQSFSLAGKRAGLDDDRGGLAIEYWRLAHRLRSRWCVWENVAGVLSQGRGRAFAGIVSELCGMDIPVPPGGWRNAGVVVGSDSGYSGAWRVLDARHFGVPQRRRRIILVGHRRDWRCAASVLFEPACGGRDHESGAQAWVDSASDVRGGPVAFDVKRGLGPHGCPAERDYAVELTASDHKDPQLVRTRSGVRRMTPLEYERLQGMPDGWTSVPYRGRPAADGVRYRAIGNAMAVPMMAWVGRRIQAVEAAQSPSFALAI